MILRMRQSWLDELADIFAVDNLERFEWGVKLGVLDLSYFTLFGNQFSLFQLLMEGTVVAFIGTSDNKLQLMPYPASGKKKYIPLCTE